MRRATPQVLHHISVSTTNKQLHFVQHIARIYIEHLANIDGLWGYIMFRKLVSNLSLSPAIVGQLSFYAKRLRKEEATRRLGLIFTALALVVQSFTLLAPPESANAADPSDMIYGGISNGSQLMAHYDANTNNIRDLYSTIGITRAELQQATTRLETRRSTESTYSWGMTPHFSAAQGEGVYSVKAAQGGMRNFYYRPHHLWGNFTYRAFVGHSAKFGWFAIMLNCGNLITQTVPPAPVCPPGQVGTYPNCSTPPSVIKPTPVASCSGLAINKNDTTYQFTAAASAQHGATITGYVFQVYRDGKLAKTLESSTPTVSYSEKTPGSYRVVLTVKTSLGDRTSEACAKTFVIAAPARCPVNPTLLKDDARCQPCPGNSTLWLEDKTCAAKFVQTKSGHNLTQNSAETTTVTAKAHDRITYKLSVTNKGLNAEKFTFSDNLSDVLQYATVVDAGGGTLAKDTNQSASTDATILSWPAVEIKPGESQERQFTVQLKDQIPSMGTGTSNATSYDCRIDNTFGNTLSTKVDCPAEKRVVEQVVTELPHTGSSENIIFAGIVLAVVVFFYARSRQLSTEIRLVRRNFNAGTI